MVDYTQPTMRDETWRRWKGGQKLADELRAFYTNQRVFDRLAIANPMAPTVVPGTPAENIRKQWALHGPNRTSRLRMSSGGRRLFMEKLAGRTAGEDKERAAALQSGATLKR